jgi:hypothetical protein
MLSDAQIDRYSRQILLPEVGGRGQERLLAARVRVDGNGAAAELAALLVGRGGATVVAADDAPWRPDVIVDLTGDAAHTAIVARGAKGRSLIVGDAGRSRVVVATLVGRPCGVCLPASILAVDGNADAPAEYALGALAAAETLRALLFSPDAGRVHRLDLASGTFDVQVPSASTGCDVCGGSA